MKANSLEELVTNSNIAGELRNYTDWHTRLVKFAQLVADWQKSQMLKEAVEGEICGRVYDHINVRFADGVCKYLDPKNISHIPANVSKYNIGDKVRIVVLKEEEE